MRFNDIVIKNVLRDKWTYISYFLSSVFSILVFFLFLITAFHPMLSTLSPNSTLGTAIVFSSFIVYIFSFIFIVYSMLSFLKKKTKNLGIFMISGASMKQIQKMVFRENMLIAIAAIITSIGLGLVISPLFLMGAKKVLKADSFGMYIPIQAIIATVISFSILFLIVSKFTTRFIKKEKAIQLLKADEIPEKVIAYAPFKLIISLAFTAVLAALFKFKLDIVEGIGGLFYILFFISFLSTMYFILTQGMLFVSNRLKNSSSYYKNTNMLFVSNLKARGNSYSHIIYQLTILLVAVFVGTSVLYSSYYNVEEKTEALYPYSLQYISLPENPAEQKENDIRFIEETLDKEEKNYVSYKSAFKTDWDRNIGFMSNTNFNSLGSHGKIELDNDEYYVISGNEGALPDISLINDYISKNLKYKGLQKEMILTTDLQKVYFVVPDAIYDELNFEENQVFAYELMNWTEKLNVIEKIEDEISTTFNQRLIASKVSLYYTERFVKSISFFIGSMLSLIFLSAAMSIVYFYLQTSFEREREKYIGIRKVGLSIREIKSIVTRELAILIFTPFTFASILLFTVLIGLRSAISQTFLQMTLTGVTIFCLLFILSFLIIRKVYVRKLVS